MKKITRFSVVIFLGIAIIFTSLNGALAASKDSVYRQPIKIGVILPLSGSIAKAGQDIQVALEIARTDLRAKYPNVTLIYEDDQFQPSKSVSAYQKLMAADRVDAIIGPLNGSSIEAVRSLANEHQLLTMTPWGSANKTDQFLLKNSMEVEDEVKLVTQTMVKKFGLKRLGIMYIQNDFGKAQAMAFRKWVPALGGELVIDEEFSLAATDWRTNLTKIKAVNIDGLYVIHNGANNGRIAKQARELGLTIPLFGQYGTESSDLVSVGGKSVEGLIYTTPINQAKLTSVQRTFVRKFTRKVGGEPQVAAYNAYDIYALVVEAVAKCRQAKVKNPACPSSAIKNRKHYTGVSGTFSLSGNRITRPLYLKVVKNGQLVMYR